MNEHKRPQTPALALVARLQAEEVEEQVQVFPVVRLRRRGVVVLVLLVVLDEGLEDDGKPTLGIRALDGAVQIVEELHGLKRIGIAAQVVQVTADTAMQNATQIRQRHELGVEDIVTVCLHELAHGLPVRVARHRLQAGKLQGLAMLNPELQERSR